jgi:hypothetical protein
LAWRGKSPDYDKFGAWFGALLEAIGVAPDRCFFCPANHDVDRSIARTTARPRNAAEADEVLGIPLASQYMNAFRSFSEFSQRFGIPPYQLWAAVSHLVGLIGPPSRRSVSLGSNLPPSQGVVQRQRNHNLGGEALILLNVDDEIDWFEQGIACGRLNDCGVYSLFDAK